MSVPAVAVAREPAVAPTSRSGRSDGFADVLATVSADAPSRDTASGPARNRPAQERPAQDRVQDRPTRDAEQASERPVGESATDPAAEAQTGEPDAQTGKPVVGDLPAEPFDLAVPQVPADQSHAATVPAAAVTAPTVPAATGVPVPAAPAVLADAVVSLGTSSAPTPAAPVDGQVGTAGPTGTAAVPAEPPTGAPVTTARTEVAEPTTAAATTAQAAASTPAAPAPTAAPVAAPAAAPDSLAVAPTVPTSAPAPTAAPVATAAPAAPAGPPTPPLVDQLGGHLRALVGARVGTHVLSIALDPKNLGEVRVVAHIAADGIRIDLAGANDAARAALRGTLDDLRRDLESAGLTAELGLADEGKQRDGDNAPRRGGDPTSPQTIDEPDTLTDPVPADPTSGHGLDLVV